jgi:hypothetical protein
MTQDARAVIIQRVAQHAAELDWFTRSQAVLARWFGDHDLLTGHLGGPPFRPHQVLHLPALLLQSDATGLVQRGSSNLTGHAVPAW